VRERKRKKSEWKGKEDYDRSIVELSQELKETEEGNE
jgi:hypothetical protein